MWNRSENAGCGPTTTPLVATALGYCAWLLRAWLLRLATALGYCAWLLRLATALGYCAWLLPGRLHPEAVWIFRTEARTGRVDRDRPACIAGRRGGGITR